MRSCEARSARLQASAIVNHAIETCSSLLPRLASLPCIDAIDADLAMRGKRALAEHPKARRIDPDFFPKLASQSILVGLLSLDMAPDHVPQSGADPRSRSCSTTALSRPLQIAMATGERIERLIAFPLPCLGSLGGPI